LAQGLLAVLLPPGDLQNPCLRALVSEVSADLVIGNFIGQRFCDGVFIYDMIRKVADTVQPRLGHDRWAIDSEEEPRDRLSRFGLLSKNPTASIGRSARRKLSDVLYLVCQYALLALSALRALIKIIITAPALPSRKTNVFRTSPTSTPATPRDPSTESIKPDPLALHTIKPIINYAAWPTVADIACLEARVPWVLGSLALLQRLLAAITTDMTESNGRIDRSVFSSFSAAMT